MGSGPDLHDSRVTFLSRRSGANVLSMMRPDGDELTPLLGGEIREAPGLRAGQSLYREPHWSRLSPDRSLYLSWTIDRTLPSTNDGAAAFLIRLGRTAGGPTRVLSPTHHTGEVFCWAPDSERVAYSRFAGSNRGSVRGPSRGVPSTQVVVASVDGTHEEVVLEKAGLWAACDWSPDGRYLLLLYGPTGSPVYGRSDLITFDLFKAREQKEKFASLRPGEDYASGISIEFGCLDSLTDGEPVSTFFSSARYSPSGSEIAVVFSRRVRWTDRRHDELGVWSVATRSLRSIFLSTDGSAGLGIRGPICWSPDGTQILFSRPAAVAEAEDMGGDRDPQDLEIWTICPDGTGARYLTDGWSPDWR